MHLCFKSFLVLAALLATVMMPTAEADLAAPSQCTVPMDERPSCAPLISDNTGTAIKTSELPVSASGSDRQLFRVSNCQMTEAEVTVLVDVDDEGSTGQEEATPTTTRKRKPLDIVFECVTMRGGSFKISADNSNKSIDDLRVFVTESNISDARPFASIEAEEAASNIEIHIADNTVITFSTVKYINHIGYLRTANASNIFFGVSGGSCSLSMARMMMSMCVSQVDNATISVEGTGHELLADLDTNSVSVSVGSINFCQPLSGDPRLQVTFTNIQLKLAGDDNILKVVCDHSASILSVLTYNGFRPHTTFEIANVAQSVRGNSNTVSCVAAYILGALSIVVYKRSYAMELSIINTSILVEGRSSLLHVAGNDYIFYVYVVASIATCMDTAASVVNIHNRQLRIDGTDLTLSSAGPSQVASGSLALTNWGRTYGALHLNATNMVSIIDGHNITLSAIASRYSAAAFSSAFTVGPSTSAAPVSMDANVSFSTHIISGTGHVFRAKAFLNAAAVGGAVILTGTPPATAQFHNNTIRAIGSNLVMEAISVKNSAVKHVDEQCASVGSIAVSQTSTSLEFLDRHSHVTFDVNASVIKVNGRTSAGAALGGVAIHSHRDHRAVIDSPQVFVTLSESTVVEVQAKSATSLVGYASFSEIGSSSLVMVNVLSALRVDDRTQLKVKYWGRANAACGASAVSPKDTTSLHLENSRFLASLREDSSMSFSKTYWYSPLVLTFLGIATASHTRQANVVQVINSVFFLNASNAAVSATTSPPVAVLGVTAMGTPRILVSGSTFAAMTVSTTVSLVSVANVHGRNLALLGVVAFADYGGGNASAAIDDSFFVLYSSSSILAVHAHSNLATVLGVAVSSGRFNWGGATVTRSRFIAQVLPSIRGHPSTLQGSIGAEVTAGPGAVVLGVSVNCGGQCVTQPIVRNSTFIITGNSTNVTVKAKTTCVLLGLIAGRAADQESIVAFDNLFAAFGNLLSLRATSASEASVVLGVTSSQPTESTVTMNSTQFLLYGEDVEIVSTVTTYDGFYDTATVLGTTTSKEIEMKDMVFAAAGWGNQLVTGNNQGQSAVLGLHVDQLGTTKFNNVEFKNCGSAATLTASSGAAAKFKAMPRAQPGVTFTDSCELDLSWVDAKAKQIVEEVLGIVQQGRTIVQPPMKPPTATSTISTPPTTSLSMTMPPLPSPTLSIASSQTPSDSLNSWRTRSNTPTLEKSGSISESLSTTTSLAFIEPPPPPPPATTPQPTNATETPPTTPPPQKVSVDTIVPVENGDALEGSSTVATAVTGLVATPTASANIARVGAALRAIDCPLSEDSPRPSTVEHPVQFEFGGSDSKSNLRWYAGSTVASTILLLVLFAQFLAISSIPRVRDRVSEDAIRCSSLVAGASYAYFTPNIAGTATTVLVHSEEAAERGACVICVFASIAQFVYLVFMVNSEEKTLRKLRVQGGRSSTTDFVAGEAQHSDTTTEDEEPIHGDESEEESQEMVELARSGNALATSKSSSSGSTSSGDQTAVNVAQSIEDPKAEIVEIEKFKHERILARLGIFFDATLRIREKLPRNYFAVDICVASFATIVAGTRPKDNCVGVAATISLISFAALLYYLFVRPFSRKIEAGFAILISVNQFLLGAMSIVAIRSDSFSLGGGDEKKDKSTFATVFGYVVMFQMMVFFLQAVVQGTWAMVRFQRRRHHLLTIGGATERDGERKGLETSLIVPEDMIVTQQEEEGTEREQQRAATNPILSAQL